MSALLATAAVSSFPVCPALISRSGLSSSLPSSLPDLSLHQRGEQWALLHDRQIVQCNAVHALEHQLHALLEKAGMQTAVARYRKHRFVQGRDNEAMKEALTEKGAGEWRAAMSGLATSRDVYDVLLMSLLPDCRCSNFVLLHPASPQSHLPRPLEQQRAGVDAYNHRWRGEEEGREQGREQGVGGARRDLPSEQTAGDSTGA